MLHIISSEPPQTGLFLLQIIPTFIAMVEALLIYIAVIVSFIAGLLFSQKDSGKTPDDPTGELKQQISDKLDKAIKDIRSTIS
jgi:hypothetical protein